MILSAIATLFLIVIVFVIYVLTKKANDKKNGLRIQQLELSVKTLLKTIDLDQVEKLMIVAHPDDETIWGGGHLLQDKGQYLVVCVTAGTDPIRDDELKHAMAICDAPYLMLGFPDLDTSQKQDRWDVAGPNIKATLEIIMTAKNWQAIVTHNPRGEYGHRHHKMVSRFVTSIVLNRLNPDHLFYFGVYYKSRYREKLHQHNPLPSAIAEIKITHMLPEYVSQAAPRKSYEHMFHYEDWVKYRDWNSFIAFLKGRNII